MTDSGDTVPEDVPEAIAGRLRESSDRQLRAVVRHAEALRHGRRSPTSTIQPREGEEIVRVEDHGADTAVVVERPGESGNARGPYVYRVRYEPAIDGGEGRFGWHYLGPVEDVPEDG